MAQSKCPACSGTQFEAVKAEPENSPHPVYFIQCAQCGAVVGTVWAPVQEM